MPVAAHSTPAHTGCGLCALRSRRLFTSLLGAGAAGLLGTPARAQPADPEEGLRRDVGRNSRFTNLIPAENLEAAAAQQYQQMLREAAQQRALGNADHPQVVRLRAIAGRIVPFTAPWNGRAAQWRWEVNLLGSRELNAFCMPGGKIAFYFGILQKLQLSDDEVAAIMGHEVAHALREHARERMGKTAATRVGAGVLSALLGLGGAGDMLLNVGGQLLTLKFSREDETEADIVGMDLAARAGYDPAAGVSLWQKMMQANRSAPPQWMSTHPSSDTRIKEIQAKLVKAQPLFDKAPKPGQRFAPPKA
ncbi:MAG TPA: M48 family metallopeptidase [Rubrivivax sp.]|nr:M48 family metallopeptidase [Rubrivivax sp.]